MGRNYTRREFLERVIRLGSGILVATAVMPLELLADDEQKEQKKSKAAERWGLNGEYEGGLISSAEEIARRYAELYFPRKEVITKEEDKETKILQVRIHRRISVKPDFGLESRIIEIVRDPREAALYERGEPVDYIFSVGDKTNCVELSVKSDAHESADERVKSAYGDLTLNKINLSWFMLGFALSEAYRDGRLALAIGHAADYPKHFGLEEGGKYYIVTKSVPQIRFYDARKAGKQDEEVINLPEGAVEAILRGDKLTIKPYSAGLSKLMQVNKAEQKYLNNNLILLT